MLKLDFNPPVHVLTQFGYIAVAGFTLIGAIATQKFGAPPAVGYVCLALAAFSGFCAAFEATRFIRPLFVALMIIAFPIGMVVSLVLLGTIYYGMFTPVGVVFRIMGKDPLERRVDRSAKSYWIRRATQRTPASYLKLY
jgi:hypothetical protein